MTHQDASQITKIVIQKAITAKEEEVTNTGDTGNDNPPQMHQYPHPSQCFAEQARKGVALHSNFAVWYINNFMIYCYLDIEVV